MIEPTQVHLTLGDSSPTGREVAAQARGLVASFLDAHTGGDLFLSELEDLVNQWAALPPDDERERWLHLAWALASIAGYGLHSSHGFGGREPQESLHLYALYQESKGGDTQGPDDRDRLHR